jgi:hypothetical protein
MVVTSHVADIISMRTDFAFANSLDPTRPPRPGITPEMPIAMPDVTASGRNLVNE